MQTVRNFIKRNGTVFFFGLIITLVFLIIIFTKPHEGNPPGFKKVEENIFKEQPGNEPKETEKMPPEYAPQVASPENKGKQYFYGEHDPNLRDDAGYPIPPVLGTTQLSADAPVEEKLETQDLEYQERQKRLQVVKIDFTDKGFTPVDAVGYTGGHIIWTNKTAKDIKIVQTLPIHEALKNGITLKPGESFDFRPLKNKQFTYLEVNTEKYATLAIVDVTQPLIVTVGEEQ